MDCIYPIFEMSVINDPINFDGQRIGETTFFHAAYPRDCPTNHGNVKCFECAQVKKLMKLFAVSHYEVF